MEDRNSLSQKNRFRIAAAAWLLGGAGLMAAPQTLMAKDFGDISVAVESAPAGPVRHGYLEYRISVTNRSPGQPHQVTLILPDTDFSLGGNRIRSIRRTVVVGPASTVDVSLLQPPVPIYGQGLGVDIDGDRHDEAVPLSFNQHLGRAGMTGSSGKHPLILISRSVVNQEFQSQALQALQNAAGELELEISSSELPVTAWSKTWLGYSSYDGVVVTSDDLLQMPAAVQSALWRYVECGGSLLIVGSWKAPPPWDVRQDVKDGLKVFNVGFGQCVVTDAINLKGLNQIQWQRLRDSWLQTRTPWEDQRDAAEANAMFPAVEDVGIPVRGLFLLMLVFVTVIGPVNLMVLSRKRKRIWLLWTVPAISLMTCVVVSGYAMFSEGWSGSARTEGLTILDEASHRATTIGWTAFYAPLTPGEGLRFGYETEVTPQVLTSFRSSGTARAIDWTHNQHLTVGWVSARVPAHFMVRKTEVGRERLAVRQERGDAVAVVNGLGADIRQLWLADTDGKMFTTGTIEAGAEAALIPIGEALPASGEADDLRRAFASDWTAQVESFTRHPEKVLRPGCYIALLETCAFIEEGLRQVESRTCRAVVYGIMKASE